MPVQCIVRTDPIRNPVHQAIRIVDGVFNSTVCLQDLYFFAADMVEFLRFPPVKYRGCQSLWFDSMI